MTVEEMDDLAAFPPSVQKWSQNFLFVGAAMLHFWTQTLRTSDFRWSRRVTLLPTHPMDSNTPPFLFTCPPAPVLMVSADGFAVTDGSLNEGKFTL